MTGGVEHWQRVSARAVAERAEIERRLRRRIVLLVALNVAVLVAIVGAGIVALLKGDR